MKVLITDANSKQSLSITRSFGLKGIGVTLVGTQDDEEEPVAFSSKFCTKKLVAPSIYKKQEYISFLLKEVQNEKYDLLITLFDVSTEYLSECRDEFAKYVKFALPEHETVLRCLNKHEMYKFAKDNGFAIPETFFPEDENGIEQIKNKLRFPLVVKYPRGGGGNNNVYCNTLEEAKHAFMKLKKKNRHGFNPVFQELLNGRKLDFHALCDHGKMIASFQSETLRAYPATGGNLIKGKTINIKEFEKTAERLLFELKYHGMANLDFLMDKSTQEIKLLEVNPRFGGNIPMALIAGVNFPDLLFKMVAFNEKRTFNQEKIHFFYYKAVFFNEIFYALDYKNSIWILLLEFLNPLMKYDFLISDLKPFFMQLKYSKCILEKKFNI